MPPKPKLSVNTSAPVRPRAGSVPETPRNAGTGWFFDIAATSGIPPATTDEQKAAARRLNSRKSGRGSFSAGDTEELQAIYTSHNIHSHFAGGFTATDEGGGAWGEFCLMLKFLFDGMWWVLGARSFKTLGLHPVIAASFGPMLFNGLWEGAMTRIGLTDRKVRSATNRQKNALSLIFTVAAGMGNLLWQPMVQATTQNSGQYDDDSIWGSVAVGIVCSVVFFGFMQLGRTLYTYCETKNDETDDDAIVSIQDSESLQASLISFRKKVIDIAELNVDNACSDAWLSFTKVFLEATIFCLTDLENAWFANDSLLPALALASLTTFMGYAVGFVVESIGQTLYARCFFNAIDTSRLRSAPNPPDHKGGAALA